VGIKNWFKQVSLDPEFNRRIEFLQQIPLFAGLSRRDVETLFQCFFQRDYHRGEVLCDQGSLGRALFLLASGEAEAVRQDPQGKRVQLAVLKTGDYFGEMSFLDEHPRSASVIAREPLKAYIFYKTEFDELSDRAPSLGLTIVTRIAQLVAARLRTQIEKTSWPS